MASYYKRYYRNKYKRYYRNNYGSSTRKKSWGNMKAAKEQSDQATFTINIPTTCSTFAMWNNEKTRCYGVYPMNIFDYLRRSEFYQSYANMYDEFKLDRVKVKLLPTSFVVDTKEGNYTTTTVYTAWDRTGIAPQQLHLVTDGYQAGDEKIGTTDNADGIRCIVGEDITTYSSAESRTISNASNTTITRWLNPKTMAEKSQWLNTSQLQKWYESFDEAHCRFYGIPVSDPNNTIIAHMENWETPASTNTSSTSVLLNASPMVRGNPCYLEEDNQVKFKPTLLVGVYPPQENSNTTPKTVRFNVEIECVCTFRGLRKAKIVA